MDGVRRYVDKIREKLRIKALFNAAIDVPLPVTVNFRPSCAMIGDAMLCTNLQDVSLVKIDALTSRIVSFETVLPEGNYKIAACKSKGVFFVADPCHVMAIDTNGNVLSKLRTVDYPPNQRTEQKVQSFACDESSNTNVSVVQTDDLFYETLTLLKWTGKAFERLGGLLDLNYFKLQEETGHHMAKIDRPRRRFMQHREPAPSPSTVQLLSPLHFTAMVGEYNDPNEEDVCLLFDVEQGFSERGNRKILKATPSKEVNLPPHFSCFTNLEPRFEVCALLKHDMANRLHPPTLEFFSDLTTPIMQIPLRDRSVALCSGNEAHQFCLCRVSESEDLETKFLAVDMFKYHTALPEVSMSGALPTAVSLALVHGTGHNQRINPSHIVK